MKSKRRLKGNQRTRNGKKTCIKTGGIRTIDVILSCKKSTEKCTLGLSNKITDNNNLC